MSDSISRNVEQWTKNNQESLDARAGAAWAENEPTWGVFGIHETDLGSPLGTAWALAEAWPTAQLVVIGDSGHTGSDATRREILAVTDRFGASA